MLASDHIRIPNIVVPSLTSLALKHGLNPEKVFSQAGIDLADIQLNELDLNLQQVEQVTDLIAALAKLPQVGLILGEHVQAEMLGVFGPLIASSPSTRVAIECFSRFKQLLHPMFDMHLEEQGQQSIITYASQDDTPIGDRPFYAEALFSALVHLGGMFVGKDIPPHRVEFRHNQPDYIDEYQRIFRCPVHFECEYDRLISDSSILDLPMLSHSFNLHQLLKQQAAVQLATSDNPSLQSRVKALIKQQLGKQTVSAEGIAAQLKISPRTLQRQLNKENTHFKALRDQVVLSQAQQLLQNTTLSTEVIAMELGYQDRSNFVHAFKRICGTTPSEYRKTNSTSD